MAELLISYSRRDSDVAREVVEALEASGRDIWIDHEDIAPASTWRERIEDGIDACSAVVFLLSPDSLSSSECGKEVDRAVIGGKKIIPVVVADLPDGDVPSPLGDLNWIFLCDRAGWEDGLADLERAIDTDLEWADFHARVLVRAVEWEESGYRSSTLLRGHDLGEAEEEFGLARPAVQAQPSELQRRYLRASRVASTSRLRRLVVVAAAAVVVVAALAVVALIQRSTAIDARDEAKRQEAIAMEQAAISRSGELAARSDGSVDPHDAAVLAVAAERVVSTAASRDAVAAAAQRLDELPADRRFGPLVGHGEPVFDVVFAPTADRIVGAGRGGELVMWDSTTGMEVGRNVSLGAEAPVLAYSPSGDRLALAGSDGIVRILDGRDLTSTGEDLPVGRPLTDVRWSADGSELMVVDRSGVVATWDPIAGEEVHVAELEEVDGLWALAISPDGTMVAGGTYGGEVAVWDADDGALVAPPAQVHDLIVYSVAWSPDGSEIASSSLDTNIAVVDARSGLTVAGPASGHAEGALSVEWSPDGEQLASSSFDGTVRLWDAAMVRPTGPALPGHTSSVSAVRWSPDGHAVASASDDLSVLVWDVDRIGDAASPATAPVRAVDWTRDDFWVAGDDGVVELRDGSTGVVSDRLVVGDAGILDMEVTADGDRLATLDESGLLVVSTASGERVDSLDLGVAVVQADAQDLRIWPGAITWAPDGTRLAAGLDGDIVVWEPGTRSDVVTIEAHEGLIMDLDWSPDGTFVASAGWDRTVGVWDLASGEANDEILTGHLEIVNAVAFSPDGTTLASGSTDKSIRLWSTTTWEAARPEMRDHLGYVTGLAWSPDGALLASSSPDRTVRLWETESGGRVGEPIDGYAGFVSAVDWNDAGDSLVAGDDSGSVRTWIAVADDDLCAFALYGIGASALDALGVTCDPNVEEPTHLPFPVVARMFERPPDAL